MSTPFSWKQKFNSLFFKGRKRKLFYAWHSSVAQLQTALFLPIILLSKSLSLTLKMTDGQAW
jgi:hypothetical protein